MSTGEPAVPMLLLDTHVLLWLAAGDTTRLGKSTQHRIRSASAVHYSPLSIAEITMKELQGRLRAPGNLAELAERSGVQPLPYHASSATAIARFTQLIGHDPLDRMLLAQAADEGADFLTADGKLLDLELGWVLDARE